MSKTVGVILALKDKCSPQINRIAERLGVTEKEAKKVNMQINKLSKELGSGIKRASQACAVGIGAITATSAMLVNQTVETTSRINDLSAK